MYKFMQRNTKKLMAFFAVGLMIVFILPTGLNRAFDPQRVTLGRVAGEKVRLGDVRGYQQAWHDASSLYLFNPQAAQLLAQDPRMRSRGLSEWEPIVPVLFGGLDADAMRDFEKEPEGFYLLVKEATGSGIVPDKQEALRLLGGAVQGAPMIGARLPGDNRIIALDSPMIDPAIRDRFATALAHVLAVRECYLRSSTMLKVSAPLEQRGLAIEAQQVRLRVHEIPVRPFVDHRQTPSDDAINAQFQRYADVAPGTITKDNPMGFGYRLPDAVKVQLVVVNGNAVREAVLASRPADRWEVEARRHYLRNPSDYPATRPATTQPQKPDEFSLGPTQQPATPTTAPFESVRDRALEAVLEPEVQRVTRSILGQITQRMQTDFTSWKAAVDSNQPVPRSSLGVSYDSVEYLEKLVEQVHAEFGVRPAIVSLASEFLTREEVDNDPRLGSLYLPPGDRGATGITFAGSLLFDLNPQFRKDARGGLMNLEPSKPLRDFSGNNVVLRTSDVRPAQKATDVAAVRDRVIADLHLVDAMEKARQQADQILGQVGERSLADANLPRVLETELFPVSGVPGKLGLPFSSQAALSRQVVELLQAAARRGTSLEPPLKKVVTLPAQPWQPTSSLSPWENLRDSLAIRTPRVLLVELVEVRGEWTDDLTRERMRLQYAESMRSELAIGQSIAEARMTGAPLTNREARSWFDFRSIVARTGYKPENPDRLNQAPVNGTGS